MNQTSPMAPTSTAPITISTIENIAFSCLGTVNQIEFAALLAILAFFPFPASELAATRWPQEVRVQCNRPLIIQRPIANAPTTR
jgi:hypothetical protein